MRLIVTGGAGFIGSNLIRYLLEHNTGHVLNLDKLSHPGSRHTLKTFNDYSNYQFVQQDLCDANSLNDLIKDYQPDIILHLAAESHVDRSIDNPQVFINSNILGTYNLLEVFRKYYSTYNDSQHQDLKFVHISTDEVYGSLDKNDGPFSEQSKYQPNSPYSASKAASDHLVRAWGHTYGLPVIITNCSNNYGPYQFPEKLIPLMINKALSGESLPVYGDGSNIRDWLYVEDHVRALACILEKGKPGETYNIGGGCEMSNIDVVDSICRTLNELKPVQNSYLDLIHFVEDRPGHDFRYAIDNSKIQAELGWSPKEDFNSGLRKTILWYLENKQWCKDVCENSYEGQRLGLGK